LATFSNEITQLLIDLSEGNRDEVDSLMPLVYSGLHQIAQRQLRGERAGHTLNSTALVHEAYLKLVDQQKVNWQNRSHFFAIASQAMRRILINYANAKKAQKRGGSGILATLNESEILGETRAEELLLLDDLLKELETMNERQSKVVEYRFFGGLTHEEIAGVLKVSVPTVRLDWRLAKAWLSRELKKDNLK
jgi:RNA polymerase sigma-70 factor, ECF subfamily